MAAATEILPSPTPQDLLQTSAPGDLFDQLHSQGWLEPLLKDMTTGKPIIWATDTYSELGKGYGRQESVTPGLLIGRRAELATIRSQKRLLRTRKHGEVLTPRSVCKLMCDHACEELGTQDWQGLVNAKILEITCGAAPFLVSPGKGGEEGCGLLDIKLKLVGENTKNKTEWLDWAFRAYETTYGYEFQGDNLLLARINLLDAFRRSFQNRFGEEPGRAEIARLLEILAWNLWQMDGLSCAIPFAEAPKPSQAGLFDGPANESQAAACRILNWQTGQAIPYPSLEKIMKFDFIIGNPPYQEDNNANSRMQPVYHRFMESVYKLGEAIELITPARFLFDAGQTPKEWNQKMLQDNHLKILYYEKDATKFFPNTEIKGGVVISYYDQNKLFDPIEIFIPNKIVKGIFNVINSFMPIPLSKIISFRGMYRFTDVFFEDDKTRANKIANGTGNMLTSRIFDVFPDEFSEVEFSGSMPIFGRSGNQRVYRYINKRYIQDNEFIDSYNVIIAEANGIGLMGESLSTLEILKPGVGHTDTFLSIGKFKSLGEARNCLKYIKSKFARTLLGILKTTQHNPPSTWKYVPLQDFTDASDIDWSKSIPEIDAQLYQKYGLDQAEIDFIESHVKEMD